MASKEFASLPEEEKVNYIKKTGRSRRAYRQLSQPEREAVSKNTTAIRRKIRMKEMKERANKFFKMSTEEQNKYLDEMNARRDRWRRAREAREANRAQASGGSNRNSATASNNQRRGGNRNARRQGFLEGMDSATRAQWTEIRRLARARREQQKK
jgi:isopenicillin N synthase-like dioxygenase